MHEPDVIPFPDHLLTFTHSYRQPGASTALDQIITTQGPLLDVPDNILFSGINVNAAGRGKRLELTVMPNKRYLMRFINTGVDDMYKSESTTIQWK